jgi:hypothetical protein
MRKLPKTTLLLLLGASGLIAISGAAVGFAAWTYANAANVTPTTAGAGASATGVVNNTSTVTGSISVSGNAVAVIDDTGYTTSGSTKIYSAVAFWADAKQDYSTDASKIVAPSMAATLTLSDATATVPAGTTFTFAITLGKTDSSLGNILDYVEDFSGDSYVWSSGVSIASSLPALTIKASAVPQNINDYETMVLALDNTIMTFTFNVKGGNA